MSTAKALLMDETEGETVPDIVVWMRSGSFVIKIAIFASVSSMMMGYDASIIPSTQRSMGESLGISPHLMEMHVGFSYLAAVPGALFAGSIADSTGRLHALMYTAMALFVGPFMTALSVGLTSLVLGRLVTGFACGAALTIVPLYVAEISPRAHRGTLVSFAELFSNVGVLVGFLIGWLINHYLAAEDAWRPMIFGGCLPALFVLSTLPLLPNSPRYLAAKGQLFEAAKLMGETHGEDYEEEVEDFTAEWERAPRGLKDASWADVICPIRSMRKVLVIGFVLAVIQQLSGIAAPIFYTTDLYTEQFGLVDESHVLLLTMIQGSIRIIGTFLAMLFLDSWGRRSVLIGGAILIALSHAVVAVSFLLNSRALMVTGHFLFIASFSATLGPGTWVVLSEIFPLVIRCHALGLSIAINRLGAAAMSLGFGPLNVTMGDPGLFLCFSMVNLVAAAVIFLNVPETKGNSLEDIADEHAQADIHIMARPSYATFKADFTRSRADVV
mmetsp:Transcript_53991/g.94773  ORF Transcript_53991/g.94773 Transcript_53991/m.94773 type:complete len:499 (-) Transcript_53991:88-1584(-)